MSILFLILAAAVALYTSPTIKNATAAVGIAIYALWVFMVVACVAASVVVHVVGP